MGATETGARGQRRGKPSKVGEKLVIISLHLQPKLLELIDTIIKESGLFANRSEYLRFAVTWFTIYLLHTGYNVLRLRIDPRTIAELAKELAAHAEMLSSTMPGTSVEDPDNQILDAK